MPRSPARPRLGASPAARGAMAAAPCGSRAAGRRAPCCRGRSGARPAPCSACRAGPGPAALAAAERAERSRSPSAIAAVSSLWQVSPVFLSLLFFPLLPPRGRGAAVPRSEGAASAPPPPRRSPLSPPPSSLSPPARCHLHPGSPAAAEPPSIPTQPGVPPPSSRGGDSGLPGSLHHVPGRGFTLAARFLRRPYLPSSPFSFLFLT